MKIVITAGSHLTVLAFKVPEPCAGKLACTVLRGGHAGNGVSLPDGKARKPYEFGVKASIAVNTRYIMLIIF